ncbi:glutaminyl-tRNA synthetase [Polaribacter pacificus]|uniref:Glutaminyl-tRNA synthetase n=1 Tax=Polaribacter pacificus TaxID=1775173 RepID=A0A917HVA8_9FLAO|nr:zinc-dependent metalloprotease [Polaribacter pacificus]GGG90358.1 glutaminyl-tRNA synthetase [Polaribacter pacificus]
MTNKILSRFLGILFVFGLIVDVSAQTKTTPTKGAPLKKGAIQDYSKVVTKDVKTDEGLFIVHKKDESYLFEIPDSLMGREMLMVTRIAKTASGIDFGGQKLSTQVLRWEQNDKKILLRVVSHKIVADKSLPVHEAVANSNFEPILFAFPIKAYNKDTKATVIDATSLFSTDVAAIGFPSRMRSRYKMSRVDSQRSYIDRISSYPQNIEIRHVKTYIASAAPSNGNVGSISLELSNSMILLPKVPMQRRYFDARVGWFTSSQTDYGLEDQKSKTVTYLDRWRLEVKDEDIEKFKRGELVEPKKQIVYYIDRATPKKWVPYIMQGINDWQVAFEAAGFKNAIVAKIPPTKEEDPEWSPEDVRYSVVRYLASPIPNANGPHVSDPRSGEILESDINWYHNVMSLLQGWYFVQTAAINPEAQMVGFKDEIMGELIKFVSSHEVGHTLGLPHNMGSSSAYSVESLRSAEFTKKFGTAPSIMDYARFNYVAQPEDKGVALMPNIGVYDKYAISWGYRPILNADANSEKATLDAWILKHAGDPLYRFGRQLGVDPSAQTEDLGDDAVKASNYGVANLKRIVPNLIKWTGKDGEDYSDLKEMYGHVISQFNRYTGHVAMNVGGIYENNKTADQAGGIYTYVPKERQISSVNYLIKQVFNTPTWLINKEIIARTEFSGVTNRIQGIQTRALGSLLNGSRMVRMIENETLNGSKAYTVVSMMSDIRKGVWSEIYANKSIDTYRRNLQRAHIARLGSLMKSDSGASDVNAIIRGELERIKRDVKKATPAAANTLTKYHLNDIVEKIDVILDPK